MKQKDIALIAVIVFISAVVSLLVSNMLFSAPSKRQEKVEVVQEVTAAFPEPDPRFFNKDAFDPTQLITIGQQNNDNPFNGTATP